MASAHCKPKETGNVQDLPDNHEAAADSLDTADSNRPQPPYASLYKQASSSPALTSKTWSGGLIRTALLLSKVHVAVTRT
jgi:hypothetical protein